MARRRRRCSNFSCGSFHAPSPGPLFALREGKRQGDVGLKYGTNVRLTSGNSVILCMVSRVLEPLNRRLMMANYNDPFEALFALQRALDARLDSDWMGENTAGLAVTCSPTCPRL